MIHFDPSPDVENKARQAALSGHADRRNPRPAWPSDVVADLLQTVVVGMRAKPTESRSTLKEPGGARDAEQPPQWAVGVPDGDRCIAPPGSLSDHGRVNGYRRFPPAGPSRRSVACLIWATLALLIANLLHQAGLG